MNQQKTDFNVVDLFCELSETIQDSPENSLSRLVPNLYNKRGQQTSFPLPLPRRFKTTNLSPLSTSPR